jgi:spore maturation protein CgeB
VKGLHISPDTINKIKQKCKKTKIICYQIENPFSSRRSLSNQWVRNSIREYDAYITWGKFLIPKLKKMGANNVILHPFAYDPELHYPTEPTRLERQVYGSDIAIIGNWYETREKIVKQLLDFDVQIWGNNWQRACDEVQECWTGRLAYMEEFSKVCNSSKVILDILKPAMLPSHSLKSFEIPACKGLLVCNSGYELSEYYENGKDIIWFDRKSNLIDNLNYLIRNDDVRSQIASSGYQTVQKHTYDARIKNLLRLYDTL